MRTGLSKKQKATNIYFNEADSTIEVCTYNTALKNRITEYAGKYPSECRLIDDDGNGCLTFEVYPLRRQRQMCIRDSNMDTACVELRMADGTMISIDCTAVENEIADNMYQRSELEYLIYNDPVAYAELILNGDHETYLKTVTEYKPLDS